MTISLSGSLQGGKMMILLKEHIRLHPLTNAKPTAENQSYLKGNFKKITCQEIGTYTCPSSCAIVKAALNPFSSLTEQLRSGSHIVPSSAKPAKLNPYIKA